jgi:hypothetical protein
MTSVLSDFFKICKMQIFFKLEFKVLLFKILSPIHP